MFSFQRSNTHYKRNFKETLKTLKFLKDVSQLFKQFDYIKPHKPNMRYSIVPEIIRTRGIQLLNEKNVLVILCKPSPFKYIVPFDKPFIVIDSFAKKTGLPEEIINVELDELKKLGFMITVTKAGRNKWFSGQRVVYRIESIYNASPGSKKINFIPSYHSIQKDIKNSQIRIVGPNAGYPHRGNGGPWIEIKTK